MKIQPWLFSLLGRLASVVCVVLYISANPGLAIADSASLLQRMQVLIKLDAPPDSGTEGGFLNTRNYSGSFSDSEISDQANVQSASVPDSVHFAGLAGTLNLAIDMSNGQPVVDGIVLSAGEVLQFVAGGDGQIGGIQGQIAIRLDF